VLVSMQLEHRGGRLAHQRRASPFASASERAESRRPMPAPDELQVRAKAPGKVL
jgi:hypothetical protein